MRLLIGGSITVKAVAEEMGEASRQVPCEFVVGTGDAKIAFDHRFLADVLDLPLSTIELGVSKHSAPGVFRSPDAPAWVEVLMPMAVRWGDEKVEAPAEAQEAEANG